MTILTKENYFDHYEKMVELYKKEREPVGLEIILELQNLYNGWGWCEVYRIDGDGIPHYRVKEVK